MSVIVGTCSGRVTFTWTCAKFAFPLTFQIEPSAGSPFQFPSNAFAGLLHLSHEVVVQSSTESEEAQYRSLGKKSSTFGDTSHSTSHSAMNENSNSRSARVLGVRKTSFQ